MSATWQDAATAPRDGSHILVTRLGEGGFGICGGEWQDWCAVVHYWSNPGEEGFYLSSGASDPFDDKPMAFTHWTHLPGTRCHKCGAPMATDDSGAYKGLAYCTKFCEQFAVPSPTDETRGTP